MAKKTMTYRGAKALIRNLRSFLEYDATKKAGDAKEKLAHMKSILVEQGVTESMAEKAAVSASGYEVAYIDSLVSAIRSSLRRPDAREPQALRAVVEALTKVIGQEDITSDDDAVLVDE